MRRKRGFTDRAEAEAALRAIENTPFTVTAVTKKKGSEAPPRLFDLTALQVECNRKFGYGADLTLEIVQQLYEAKYTTYPRVDTTFLPTTCTARARGFSTGSRDCTAISSRRCAERSCTSQKRCSIRRK